MQGSDAVRRCYREIEYIGSLSIEVEKRLTHDTLALPRRDLVGNPLVAEDTLDGHVDAHRAFEFARAAEVRPALSRKQPVELLEQLALVRAEPDAGRRAAAVGWHGSDCKPTDIAVRVAPAAGRAA
jgi:hypothetical protein